MTAKKIRVFEAREYGHQEIIEIAERLGLRADSVRAHIRQSGGTCASILPFEPCTQPDKARHRVGRNGCVVCRTLRKDAARRTENPRPAKTPPRFFECSKPGKQGHSMGPNGCKVCRATVQSIESRERKREHDGTQSRKKPGKLAKWIPEPREYTHAEASETAARFASSMQAVRAKIERHGGTIARPVRKLTDKFAPCILPNHHAREAGTPCHRCWSNRRHFIGMLAKSYPPLAPILKAVETGATIEAVEGGWIVRLT